MCIRDSVEPDQRRDDRVEPLPAGQGDEADPHDDAGRGPDVGEQVLAVGDQRRRAMPPALLQQHPGHGPVDRGGEHADQQALSLIHI